MPSKKKITNQPIIEEEEVEVVLPDDSSPIPTAKPKRIITEEQREVLAGARIKATERKKEIAEEKKQIKELEHKAKLLEIEKLKKKADEYDELTTKKSDLSSGRVSRSAQDKPKKKNKKRYSSSSSSSSESEPEEKEIVVKKQTSKKQQSKPTSLVQLTNLSVQEQLRNRIQDDKINYMFSQLTGRKY